MTKHPSHRQPRAIRLDEAEKHEDKPDEAVKEAPPRKPRAVTGMAVIAAIPEAVVVVAPDRSVVAANAQGDTVMRGVRELRVKESDRIEAMARGLRANGVTVEDGPDWWIVKGLGAGAVPGGATVETFLDHRIAMSFLCLGMAAKAPVALDDGAPVATSFPIFEPLMAGLGADIRRGG